MNFYNEFSDDNNIYFLMEYINGINLLEYL